MKKLLFLFLLIFTIPVLAQETTLYIDTATFISGQPSVPSDSSRVFDIRKSTGGVTVPFLYAIVKDTNVINNADSIGFWGVTKRASGDSVVYPLPMWFNNAGTWQMTYVSCVKNATTVYWIYDAFVEKVYAALMNKVFTNKTTTGITLKGVNR